MTGFLAQSLMNSEAAVSAAVAACTKEVSAHIFQYAHQTGHEPLSFLVNVAAVLAASALAAQPEERLAEAAAHMRHGIGLVHCVDDDAH